MKRKRENETWIIKDTVTESVVVDSDEEKESKEGGREEGDHEYQDKEEKRGGEVAKEEEKKTGQETGEQGGQGEDAERALYPLGRWKEKPLYQVQRCPSVQTYEKICRIQEGAYGVVYKARHVVSGEVVALKRFKSPDGRCCFPVTTIREISCLRRCAHENVVDVREVVVNDDYSSFYMVMPYIRHDLRHLMREQRVRFAPSEVKCLMLQLMRGVVHIHENWILHRDLKTSNLLLSDTGVLKIADFGLSRLYGDPPIPLTPGVVTLHYRSPEVLLGSDRYDVAVDIWSVGCVFAELISGEPLFSAARTDVEMIGELFEMLGTPDEASWPGVSELFGFRTLAWKKRPAGKLQSRFARYTSPAGVDLLAALLTCDPRRRIRLEDALKHLYFSEDPLPRTPETMQSFPSSKK